MTNEINESAQTKRARDFEDLQHELAGTSAGRPERFLSHDAKEIRDPDAQRRKRDRDASSRSIRLAGMASAEAHRIFLERLMEAEIKIATAINRVDTRYGEVRDDLAHIRENATRAPDGIRVYQDKNGQIWSEDGRDMSHLTGVVIFPDTAPSYEAFIAKRNQMEAVQQQLIELQRIQVDVLGAARDLYEDDDPLSQTEMDDILAEIEAATAVAEAALPATPMTDQAPRAAALSSLSLEVKF